MTPRTLALMGAIGLLAACTGKDGKPADTDDTGVGTDTDTGVDTDSGDTSEPCTASVLSTEPVTGATAVYYRDPLVVSFEGDGSAATLALTDAGGADVAFETTWADGGVQATLATVLAADTTYTLTVDVCGVETTTSFTTSSLGAPLTVGTADLLGRTFVFRLSDATITEPSFLDFVASTYLTVPLLISVTAADSTSLDLLGGLGVHENDGTYTQMEGEETWDFPSGDFTEQPYFEAYSEYITITYDGLPIPIEQFHLSGTFTADGTQIQRGVASGLGDTRHMAPLLGKPADEYDALCALAAGAGVMCEPCADGEPYCIYIVAEEITATWEAGLAMSPVE
ncbi:MAG: Ig-like domain-containing protein [Myxococcota bacterium]